MGVRRFGPDTSHFLTPDFFYGSLADLSLSIDPLTDNRYDLAGGNPISFKEWDGHMVLADGGGGASTTPTTPPPARGHVCGGCLDPTMSRDTPTPTPAMRPTPTPVAMQQTCDGNWFQQQVCEKQKALGQAWNQVTQAWNQTTGFVQEHGKEIVGTAGQVMSGAATGIDKAREAARPVVSKLSAALRAGSSIGGKYLKPASRLARGLEDVPGLGEGTIIVSFTLGLASGMSPAEVAGGTLGGLIGGLAGAGAAALVCLAGLGTAAGDLVICPAAVIALPVAGGYFGGLGGEAAGRRIATGKWEWSWI
jgi:hypothetical protein